MCAFILQKKTPIKASAHKGIPKTRNENLLRLEVFSKVEKK